MISARQGSPECSREGPDQCTPWTEVGQSNPKTKTQEMLQATFAHLSFGAANQDSRRFCVFTVSKEQKSIRIGPRAKSVKYLKLSGIPRYPSLP